MKFTPRLERAVSVAARLHKSQTRRDKEATPYVTHLYSVMLLVSSVAEDEDTLIAALMHDSLEDVPGFSKEMLEEEFGGNVANIVSHVTEPYIGGKDIPFQKQWLLRKEAYLKNLQEGDTESAIVSCADKLHNLSSFIRNYEEEGDEFLKRFHGSMKNQLEFYGLVLVILREKLSADNTLLARLESVYKEAQKLFENHA